MENVTEAYATCICILESGFLSAYSSDASSLCLFSKGMRLSLNRHKRITALGDVQSAPCAIKGEGFLTVSFVDEWAVLFYR